MKAEQQPQNAMPLGRREAVSAAKRTIEQKAGAPGATTGFDYLRVGLSLAVLTWHSLWIAAGLSPWNSPLRFLPATIIPAFFALSGYLVAGSLQRNTLRDFLTLRAIRILPALTVEVALSAVVIGLFFTTLTPLAYLTNRQFFSYFLNIIGHIHYILPGVFPTESFDNRKLNAQLWTIPYEFKCYLSLAALGVLGISRNRLLVTIIAIFLVAESAISTLYHARTHVGPATFDHASGHTLILAFLAGVSIYMYRDVLPYSGRLALLCAIIGGVCLEFPQLNALAAFPVAYLTVWLGLKRPPAIPFGDLSYGIYLFHYPIEQSVKHLFPGIDQWWALALLSLPVILAFAFLSWTFVEHPVLRRKKPILAAVDAVLIRVRAHILARRYACYLGFGKRQDAGG